MGAYKISGGVSGGVLPFLTTLIVGIAFAAIISVGVLTGGWALLAAGWAAMNFLMWASAIEDADNWEELNALNLVTTLGLSLGVIGLFKLGIQAIPLIITGEGFAFLLGLI